MTTMFGSQAFDSYCSMSALVVFHPMPRVQRDVAAGKA